MNTAQEASGSVDLFLKAQGARVEKNLAMSPEADDFLAELARRTGLKEGDVIRLALVLFKTAVDAKERGQHVGIADTSEALDIELVGF